MKGIIAYILIGAFTLLYGAIGEMVLATGEVDVVRQSNTIKAFSGMQIEEKDIVNTQNGQAQLRFDDETIVSIGKNTHFSIDTYLNTQNEPQVKFRMGQGSVGVITGKIGKVAPQNFNIQTRTSTIGIRGTILKVHSDEKFDTISCIDGKIEVASIKTDMRQILEPGRSVQVSIEDGTITLGKPTVQMDKIIPIEQENNVEQNENIKKLENTIEVLQNSLDMNSEIEKQKKMEKIIEDMQNIVTPPRPPGVSYNIMPLNQYQYIDNFAVVNYMYASHTIG